MSAFKKEQSLAEWLGKSTISITGTSDTDTIIKKPILINYNIATRRHKLLEAYSKKYPKDEKPILAEIDHIYIHEISYPNNDNTDTGRFFAHKGEFYPAAAEIKYFRVEKGKKRKINGPYYAGLGVVSTNILPGLSYQVLPKKMHSISPVFLVVSTVFYWLSQF